ncbi:MAG: hypothetical protein MRY78_16945, partial [Saprospiraceae bacterium]|nr:hypothetical protein [Saprospiraceae bacterium]
MEHPLILFQGTFYELFPFFRDSPFSWVTLLTGFHTVGVLLIGFRILFLDSRKYLYRSCFILCLVLFMMLWANYELIRSTDIELASWFSRLRQLFSYLATALIAITLWYYARFFKIISNKGIRYFMLFGMLIPAFGFAALECTPYFFGTVVQISNNNWGIKIDQVSLLDWLRFIWTAIAFIASLVFTLFSYFSAKDKQQRPIRLFLVFVMAIGLSITLYQSYIVPLFFSFNIVRNDSFIVFWGVLIYALAFSDLKLFRLEPNRAVDSILQSMTNLMIITNNYFQIKDVNQAAIQFFQKDLNDIQDQLIAQLLQEETWTHVRER